MASEHPARRRAPPFIDPPGYARHRPEATLLYRLVEQYYPSFLAAREAAGRSLPRYVQEEFEAYLKCGRLEHGFLRARCADCHAEKLVAFSCKRRGFCPSCGARRMAESAALPISFVGNFLLLGEFKTARVGMLVALPFKRCLALLVTIAANIAFDAMLPAFASTTAFAVVVIVLKTLEDAWLHKSERRGY